MSNDTRIQLLCLASISINIIATYRFRLANTKIDRLRLGLYEYRELERVKNMYSMFNDQTYNSITHKEFYKGDKKAEFNSLIIEAVITVILVFATNLMAVSAVIENLI